MSWHYCYLGFAQIIRSNEMPKIKVASCRRCIYRQECDHAGAIHVLVFSTENFGCHSKACAIHDLFATLARNCSDYKENE